MVWTVRVIPGATDLTRLSACLMRRFGALLLASSPLLGASAVGADGLNPAGPLSQGLCYASGTSGPRVPCALQGQTWSRILGAGDPGEGLSFLMPDGATVRRGLVEILRSLPVLPADYGAKCNQATDDAAAYQRAANAAKASGRPLYIGGSQPCLIQSTVSLNNRMRLVGDGPGQSVLVTTNNIPILSWNASGEEVKGSLASGFTLRGQYGQSDVYSNSAGIFLSGDAVNYFQYNSFVNLVCESLYNCFIADKGTRTTPFGKENMVNWITFDNISIRNGSRSAHFAFNWKHGSGTGTTYSNIKTDIGDPTGSVFNYGGAVTGDIVINNSHFGGTPGASLIKIDSSTTYRNNILISGSQLDAGMNVPFDFPQNPPTPRRVSFTGNNLGGTVALSYPPVANSLIDDQLADQRRAGKVIPASPQEEPIASTGATNLPLFRITLDALTPYTGTDCTIAVSGLVNGVGGGIVRQSLLLARSGGDATVTPVAAAVTSQPATGFYAISTSVSGAAVTISTTFAPTLASSNIDAQIRCVGGTYSLSRL